MPTYDYGCEACGAQWELEQRISEDPIKKCPKCGKRKAKRLISGGNFILKGGGWYADLYHKPKGGSSKTTEGGDAGKSAEGSSASDASSSSSSSEGGSKSKSKKSKSAATE
ncbi:MAG TPA: zinc ribbon domain-containing protein [Sandaracinaceae bacterium LLY-WYZ-13_1]|nr:zinc ribbon domain-containing protein [Sandaracinaceae bacterium LLY-WYZ-13_1]